MSKWNTRSLCRVAMMAALYLPLARWALEFGTLKLSLGSLPITVLALLAGPWEAAAAAFIGEFLKQMLSYGFTATTLLWIIPPVLRGLLIGMAAVRLGRSGTPLEERGPLCCTVSVVSAVIVTLSNCLPLWLDSVIYGYYFPGYIVGALAARLAAGIATAVVVAVAAMPVVGVLRRQGLAVRKI